jgi:hypothetical protein
VSIVPGIVMIHPVDSTYGTFGTHMTDQLLCSRVCQLNPGRMSDSRRRYLFILIAEEQVNGRRNGRPATGDEGLILS